MKIADLRVPPKTKIRLKDYETRDRGDFKSKQDAQEKLASDIEKMKALQDVFYADDTYSLLIIFQAMDAAGKDGAIKHVMSGLNPQGCQVAAFKKPSDRELDHDYLWRCNLFLPERGRIGIFNRSYYEDVLIVRVHPEILATKKLPDELKEGKIWERRYKEINNWEKYLTDNGTRIIKFFLNVSKDEQKERFMQRIERPEKNWKLSPSDVKERAYWDDYQGAYEDMLSNTSTKDCPWYVVPADHKWYSRVVVSEVIVRTLEGLDLKYPKLDKRGLEALEESKKILLAEKD